MTTVRTRYSTAAIILHWAIALLILANLFVGWRMGMLKGLAEFTAFQLHKSIGISVLVLSVLRLALRLWKRPPPLPDGMRSWERAAASATHWIFYAMMIGLPLTGWAMVSVSAFNIPTLLWDTVPWPHISFLHELPTENRATVEEVSENVHYVMAWGGAFLILLHVAAALKHQFISRDDVLGRMLPFRATRPTN